MIIIHKKIYTGSLGQNFESEWKSRFGGQCKSIDRDDLVSRVKRED